MVLQVQLTLRLAVESVSWNTEISVAFPLNLKYSFTSFAFRMEMQIVCWSCSDSGWAFEFRRFACVLE